MSARQISEDGNRFIEANLFVKLGVNDRTAAVTVAVRRGTGVKPLSGLSPWMRTSGVTPTAGCLEIH